MKGDDVINNRPGLPHIAYRAGTYSDFRQAIFKRLCRDEALEAWTHREADDPGIALLEGACVLGDILTFYQELYANEAYLRTATWRESITDIVRLLGYRLSPGVAGKATFAFEVKGDKPVTVPEGFPLKAQVEGLDKQVDFETVQDEVAYPALSKFNLYRPVLPQVIASNTKEFYIASPDQQTSPIELEEDDRLLIGQVAYGEKAKSPGMLSNAQIVIVDKIRDLHGLKIFSIKGTLSHDYDAGEIVGFKLGRSFLHFGHNAPRKIVTVSDDKVVEREISYLRSLTTEEKTTTIAYEAITREYAIEHYSETIGDIVEDALRARIGYRNETKQTVKAGGNPWGTESDFYIGEIKQCLAAMESKANALLDAMKRHLFARVNKIVDPALRPSDFPLDSEVKDLPAGTQVAIQINRSGAGNLVDYTFVRKAVAVASTSMTWESLSGATTIVTVESALTGLGSADIRGIEIHEVTSPILRLRAAFEDEPAAKGKRLCFVGSSEEAKPLLGRRLILENPGSTPLVPTVMAIDGPTTAGDHPALCTITLDSEVTYSDFPHTDPAVTVYGNLADATQGKSEKDAVLGNGDARQTFQTFKLPKAPLTYLNSVGETPPEVPEIEIYVDGRLWQRVSTLFGHGADDEIYIVREDTNGDSWVQFGDGKTGKRLPSGIRNIVARYRTGTGAYGALKEDTTAQAGGKLERLKKVHMPGVVSGGAEPESGDNAREAAPGKVLSLGRLVSLKDYEAEALAIPGVLKALAVWDIVDSIPTVVITVMTEEGREAEIDSIRQILAGYNRCRGPQRFPVEVQQGKPAYVYLAANVAVDTTYKQQDVVDAVTDALGEPQGLFSFARRTFGQEEFASTIVGVIQNVEGVVWAEMTGLELLGEADGDPSSLEPSTPVPSEAGLSCTNLQVLNLYKDHLNLVALAASPVEEC
jgi:hypothetical protein